VKDALRLIVVPEDQSQFEEEVDLILQWYNEHRPHVTLGGQTPNEVYYSRPPANEQPRYRCARRPILTTISSKLSKINSPLRAHSSWLSRRPLGAWLSTRHGPFGNQPFVGFLAGGRAVLSKVDGPAILIDNRLPAGLVFDVAGRGQRRGFFRHRAILSNHQPVITGQMGFLGLHCRPPAGKKDTIFSAVF
jgi:hypothetical protein